MTEASDSALLLQFVYELQKYGLESMLKLFYGFYRGTVTSNEDPEERGRIKAQVDDLGQKGALDIWVPPVFDMASNGKGSFWPPELGDSVRIFYHHGNPSQPFGYLGGWFGTTDTAEEFKYTNKRPEKRGFVTRLGHQLVFSEEKDNEYVRLLWHKCDPGDEALADASVTADRTIGKFAFVELTKTGSVQLMNANGSFLAMDAESKSVMVVSEHGHAITMTADGITLVDKDGNLVTLNKGDLNASVTGKIGITGKEVNLSAAGVSLGFPAPLSAVCGEPLMLWLASHVHPTGVGPSGPPIIPPPPVILSKSVKLKG